MPAETACLESARGLTVQLDWMVVCAVICEPVSIANSLLSGKLKGNFAKSGVFGRIRTEIETVVQALVREFPKNVNREFLPIEQGISNREQGNQR
jgi:hypothetical protein